MSTAAVSPARRLHEPANSMGRGERAGAYARSSPWWSVAAWIAVPLLAVALVRDRFTSSTLAAAAVQGLFAVSWLPLAATGQPSLGHALPYGAGAYAAAFVARGAGLHPGDLNGFAPLVLTATAAAAGACLAAVQGRLARCLAPAFVATITLATVEAAHSLATMWRAPVMRGVAEGDTAIPIAAFASDEHTIVWIAAAAFGAGVLFVAALLRSRAGIALRVAGGGERDAAALGFDAPRLRLAAFAVAGAIAGAAGVLAAQFAGRASPAVFSLQASLFVPATVLIGGIGSVAGPAAAAYVTAAAALFFDVPASIQLLAFAAVLAAAGLRDPEHLLGTAFRWTPSGAYPAGRSDRSRDAARPRAAARDGSR